MNAHILRNDMQQDQNSACSQAQLVEQYNKPVPRYTSYPTVPYWSKTPYQSDRWLKLVRASAKGGVSVYVHLPFCEKLCTYCGCSKRITKRHEVEAPYVDAVLAEWDVYRRTLPANTKLNQLHLGGGTPTFFSSKELNRLVSGLTAGFKIPSRRDFSVEIHPATTSFEQLQILARTGFNRVSIGVQDTCATVLGAINRPQTVEQVTNCTEWARSLGFKSVNFDFVYGLPFQTTQQIESNVRLIEALRPDRIAHYAYAHVPWHSPGQRSYSETDLPTPLQKWQLRETADVAIQKIGYSTVGFDHYALPSDRLARAARRGKLSRNFMGFTTHPTTTLIGLGASAISEVDGAFAQNLKKVEDYSVLASSGQLAHFRGHQPKGRDVIIARLIRELMCTGRTELPRFDLGYTVPTLTRLKDLLSEGLVLLDGLEVKLTEKGQVLARHVALALDEYYWRKQPNEPLFSSGV